MACIMLIFNVKPFLQPTVNPKLSKENDVSTKIITGVVCASIAGILVIKLSEI